MSELLDAIERHLGVRVSADSLNHYSMLGLEMNAGPNEIKQALRTAVAAWNASETKNHPASAQCVAKLIKQAQAVLLDSTKKQEYDKQINCQDLLMNPSFLPSGDPFAPFDPSECLVGAGASDVVSSFGSVNQRWEELCRQIPVLGQSSTVPIAIANRLGSNQTTAHGFATTIAIEPRIRGESAVAKIERLKRKRKLTQRLYVAGFLAFAAVFLAYAGLRFVWNRQQIAQKPRGADTVAGQTKKSAESGSRSSASNDAPKTTATDSVNVLPSLDKNDSSARPGVEYTESNPFGSASTTPTSLSGPTVSEMENPIAAKPIEVESILSVKPGATRSEWIGAMSKAREAVDKADFSTFHKYMKIAFSQSSNDEMVSKQARLDQLGQLYELFLSSIREAKTKLNGAETISVGKLQVNIVEIKEDQLIVRIQGKNETFEWDRLPPGIAMALADLTLSDQEPTDIAARAVYCSLSPVRNQLFEKRVKDWFEKSVGKGKIRKDLVQALTDTYE